jgi:manganese transport protein
VQAELARYVVATGDTYVRALNRIPGRLPFTRVRASWTLWLSLLAFIPGTIGMGGIVGGSGQALGLMLPSVDPRWLSLLAAGVAAAILGTGSYPRLQWTTGVLVAFFVATTAVAAVAMQSTDFRVTAADLTAGFSFEFPAGTLLLALAVYGATGVNSAEIAGYTYWCIEKGYPSLAGAAPDDPDWLARARGWIGVLQQDVWLTLLILTAATVPFYLLGAGVLHASGLQPQGLDTVRVLSGAFTETLGAGSLWLFAVAAFCILYSSVIAGFGGISRFLPDCLVEFGWLDRADLANRKRWTRIFGAVLPLASGVVYLAFPDPVALLTIGALMGAALLPVQSGATIWLQRRLDARLRPGAAARALLWCTFLFQAGMAALLAAVLLAG